MPERLTLSSDELLKTIRSVLKRLDFTRPVKGDVPEECLTIAQQAPTGSNGQHWHFVVVTDSAKRAALAELYRKGWDIYTTLPFAASNLTFQNAERNTIQAVSQGILETGGMALAIPRNVSDPGQVEAMVARAVERFGRVDILVNNAGVAPDGGTMPERISPDVFEQIVPINL